MLNSPPDRGSGNDAPQLRRMRAEHERYRLALGLIQQTTGMAARCSCCLAVTGIARDALTPLGRLDDWLRCEA